VEDIRKRAVKLTKKNGKIERYFEKARSCDISVQKARDWKIISEEKCP